MPTLKLDGDASGAVKATSDVGNAARKLDQEFKQVGLTTDQLREQMQKAFDEKPIDRYIRKCEEMAQKVADGKMTMHQYTEQTERLAKGLKQTGEAHEESFGGAALGHVLQMAGGMLTLEKAVEAVTEALHKQHEEKVRAAENVTGGLPGAGELANASDTPEKFAHGAAFARKLMNEGIVPRNQQALAYHIAAGATRAETGEDDEEFLMKLGKQKRIAAGQMGEFAENIASYRESFGGSAGSFQDVGKEVLRASSDTLGRTSPDEFAKQLDRLAPAAQENGLDSEHAMAAYAAILRTSTNKKTGTSRAEDFLTGKTDMTDKESERYAIELQRIQAAPGEEMPDYIGTDPRMRAGRGYEEAEGRKSGTIEDMTAERQSLYGTIRTRRDEADRKKYGYGVSGALNDVGMGIGDTINTTFGREDAEIKHAVNSTPEQQESRGLTPEDVDTMKDYLRRIAENSEEASRQPPAPSGRQE